MPHINILRLQTSVSGVPLCLGPWTLEKEGRILMLMLSLGYLLLGPEDWALDAAMLIVSDLCFFETVCAGTQLESQFPKGHVAIHGIILTLSLSLSVAVSVCVCVCLSLSFSLSLALSLSLSLPGCIHATFTYFLYRHK